MSNLLYGLAVLLVIFWALGFFAFGMGGIVHILLGLAFISVLLRVIQGQKI